MKFQIGELVRWITEYDDYIVKDTGHGIIVGTTEYSYQQNSYFVYEVYRNEKNDKVSIPDKNIFRITTKEK